MTTAQDQRVSSQAFLPVIKKKKNYSQLFVDILYKFLYPAAYITKTNVII